MIEMWSKESNEEETFDLMAKTSEFLTVLDDFQKKIIKKIGVEKILIPKPEFSSGIISLFDENIKNNLEDILFTKENDFKSSGKESLKKMKDLWTSLCQTAVKNGNLKDDEVSLKDQFLEEKIDEFVHDMAINKKKRFDGRGVDDIRPLFAQAGKVSESLHGSGIFYRGGTHILSVLTLGGREDAQVVDGMEVSEKKRFMLHYNFPPYSVGEVGRFGGLNRRMIGHGALAEKALSSVIPSEDVFPYTIRIVAESMASNGSTSMASVCASTLALMDGGVPIEKPVAGISIGLMENKDNFVVLTDIAGPEDHHGDMDFKVAGTRDGITAIQMDIKVSGIRLSVLKEALDRAKIARIKILDVIESEISKPRENLSSYAPVIDKIQIKTDQIGLVIGPSGKTVNAIRKKTDTNITIEDDGLVYVTGPKSGVAEAISTIESMTKRYEVGDKLTVTITKIVDFGAFAQMSPNAEGLIHISEINDGFSESVDKFLKVGQTVPVIIKDIDERGRYKLSIKSADPNFFKNK
jgi:polyribonucleotide nucleotidyltransferase